MFRVIAVQALATVVISALAAVLGGSAAAITALAGGMACTLPNGLFALRLAQLARRRSSGYGAALPAGAFGLLPILVGEFFKLLLTLALLASLAWGYKDVVWLALIVSVGAVLLVQTIALARPTR